MMNSIKVPQSIESFLKQASADVIKAMSALSAAVVLTDDLAIKLLEVADLTKFSNQTFLEILHSFDFIIERNSEWHIQGVVREYFLHELYDQKKELAQLVHATLHDISIGHDTSLENKKLPRYLKLSLGEAYHLSLSKPTEALERYSRSYSGSFSGEQWLLGELAYEQLIQGLLPYEAIEPYFFQGMMAYREGNDRRAKDLLNKVAYSDQMRKEVAIAAHALGVIFKKEQMYKEAEELLRRSLAILEQIKDRYGEAQVLHSLGQMLGKDRNRSTEAEELLRRSLAILEQIKDRFGEIMVLSTLGEVTIHTEQWEKAQQYYSLVRERGRTPIDLAIAYAGLSIVAERKDLDIDLAIKYIELAINYQKRTGRWNFIRKHEHRLRELLQRRETDS